VPKKVEQINDYILIYAQIDVFCSRATDARHANEAMLSSEIILNRNSSAAWVRSACTRVEEDGPVV